MKHSPDTLTPLVLFLVAACGDVPGPEPERIWAERDSAGVIVAENRIRGLGDAGW